MKFRAHKRLVREMLADGRLVYDDAVPSENFYFINVPHKMAMEAAK